MELSQKIYELRTGSGLSQLDLAEKLGVSRQSVSKWETGQAVPDLDKLIRLADLFGISVDELVREEERPAPPEPQVVYAAEQRGFSPVQKAGAALEVVGLLGLVLGGMGLVSLIGAGLMLLGLPLLLCKKHPWLWMGWTAVAISLLVFNPHTSVSPWGLFGGMRYLYWILTNPELRYYASYFAAAIGILRGSLILLLIFLGIRARRRGSGAKP